MAWLALNHGINNEPGRKPGGWKVTRDKLHQQICRRGFNREVGSFVQAYDSDALDASALLIPIVGFLPFEDERVRSTVDVIQKKLCRNGYVYRVPLRNSKDEESAFVACSFWMVQSLAGIGRRTEAEKYFEKLISNRNDVGLLSEEYDPIHTSFMGNFPQALSHIALINAAIALYRA